MKSFGENVVMKTMTSLPSWERGLKSHIPLTGEAKSGSLPSWERGLKSFYLLSCSECLNVAPLVGAWIEINPITEEETGTRRRSPRGSVD